jgi:peptidoglycan/LPS O-acetylase OafA/YrhL
MTSTLTHHVSLPAPTVVERVRPAGRVGRTGLVAGIGAAAANLAIVAVAERLDVAFEIKGEKIPRYAFGQVTLFAAIIGIAMAAVFARRARRPRHAFVVTTVVLTALSMVPPAIVDAAVATKLMLGVTHAVAAAIIIPALASRLADETTRRH